MKRKKIDFWLSIAGFCQLCVLGVSGSLYAEITSEGLRWELVKFLAAADAVFMLGVVLLWLLINKRIKK